MCCDVTGVDNLKVEDKYRIADISSGVSLNFLPKHGLYTYDSLGQKDLLLDDLPALGDDNDIEDDEDESTPRIYATTADQNKLLYTLREIKAADAARQLVKSMAYLSMIDMFSA